jgi:selenocysteine lyase/cysteine desulfurase
MATIDDAEALLKQLWQRHRIQAMVVLFGERLLLRVSAQVYVGEEDIDALVAALAQDGWPAR